MCSLSIAHFSQAKHFYKLLVIFLVIVFTSSSVHAQLSGADLYYTYQAAGRYEITLTLSYTCFGTEPETEQRVVAFESSGNKAIPPFSLKLFSSGKQNISSSSTCIKTPGCIKQAVYKGEMDLPPVPGGYEINWNTCCLAGALNNIDVKHRTGFNLTAKLPGIEQGAVNSMPQFSDLLFSSFCKGQPGLINAAASDADGDSLVYELQTPFTMNSFNNNNASSHLQAGNKNLLPDAPPYHSISFAPGFSNMEPLGRNAVKINKINGSLEINADMPGNFLLGYSVREYRQSKLISSHQRVVIITVNP